MKFEHFTFLMNGMFDNTEADDSFPEKYDSCDAGRMHPLVLAYVGDAFFTLFVRTRLLAYQQEKVRILHTYDSQIVSAAMQAVAFRSLAETLSEQEMAVYRRGRNAKSTVPKSATVAEYRSSTGFEALLGFLYLSGEVQRLSELAEQAFKLISREIAKKQ